MFDWDSNSPLIKFTIEKRNKKMMVKTKENVEQKSKKIKKIKMKFFEFSFDFKSKVKKEITKLNPMNNFVQYKMEVRIKNTLLGLTTYLTFLIKTIYLYI